MKLQFLDKPQCTRLLLIFTGWASDAAIFRNLRSIAGYDMAVVWDYRDYELPADTLGQYREIVLMAWSFGVSAATDFISANPHLPFTLRIAINGTLTPVDDNTGIPCAIFEGTLNGLNERSLAKFYRRMCGSADAYARFKNNAMPCRDISELADELRAVASRSAAGRRPDVWNVAVISDADAIIPTTNQLNHWHGHQWLDVINGAHLPDFQNIIDRYVIDKSLVAKRFEHSADTYGSNAKVQQDMARQLSDMLCAMCKKPLRRMIEVGAGTGLFTHQYMRRIECSDIELWDLNDIDTTLPGRHMVCDAETEIRRQATSSADAVVSAATIQWFNSPADFVKECYRVLAPGGVLAISTFGDGNFKELDGIMHRRHYLSAAQWRNLLHAAGIEANVAEQTATMTFDSSPELMRHLRRTGVNALTASGNKATSAALAIMRSNLRTLTYHPIYITAIKPV